jgi:uridine phosphorylase
MTIIDAFDNATEAIIHPSHTAPPVEGFPRVAIASFSDAVMAAFCGGYDAVKIDNLRGGGADTPVYMANYKGVDIAGYRSRIGGPGTALHLEGMISKGCRKFVFFGSCGVLDWEIAEQALLVPTAAYRDEGTSYHYAPPGLFIDIPSAPKLADIFDELNLSYTCGKTWTTDAPFRETRGNVEKRKNAGCIAVEMECASIMAVAQFRGVEAYQFLYAADNLDAAEWDARTLGSLPQDAGEAFLRIALEVAIRL